MWRRKTGRRNEKGEDGNEFGENCEGNLEEYLCLYSLARNISTCGHIALPIKKKKKTVSGTVCKLTHLYLKSFKLADGGMEKVSLFVCLSLPLSFSKEWIRERKY